MKNPVGSDTQRADLEFVRKIMKAPLLEREEELKLATAWKEDRDEQALHKLICAYTRLVVSIAVRFRHYGLPVGDLIQEGNIGLLHAADRFEVERGVRFSSYAKWWIRSFIQDYVLRNWSIVRTGSTTAQKLLFFNLRRLRRELADVTTDLMNPEERTLIAEKLNVNLKDVEEMEGRLLTHDFSLSSAAGFDGEELWVNLLQDERLTPEEETFSSHDATICQNLVKEALENLNEREQYIINSRRLADFPETLETIGKKMNISKGRVRQLEVRALRKMRYYLQEHLSEVKEFLD